MSATKAWSKSVEKPATEFPLTPLPILRGKIPEQLRGTLYRNGPARLERGGKRVGHWFDGDGAILAVHFTNDGASAVYRYVQTQGYQEESRANKFLYPNYGMKIPGPFWYNWGKPAKNAANTSVLALADKLLALWEGGLPYALNPHTLETWGTDNLSQLNSSDAFSAHPKIDSETGDVFNFGMTIGLNATLHLYRCDSNGKLFARGFHQLSGIPLIHDFVMAGEYLIFFVPPVRINVFPVILGLSCFSDCMQWQPELGTDILVFDRDNLSLISHNKAEPWYQWHYVNGYVLKDGFVSIDLVRYHNFDTNQNLKEVASAIMKTPADGTLWRFILNPKTGKLIESSQLCNRPVEFPIVAPNYVGKSWNYTYLATHRDGVNTTEEMFGAIARFNNQKGELTIADMGENCYPSEPILVEFGEEEGWILTVIYEGNENRSEVRIYESSRLEDEPICCLELPGIIPPGFHGTWKGN